MTITVKQGNFGVYPVEFVYMSQKAINSYIESDQNTLVSCTDKFEFKQDGYIPPESVRLARYKALRSSSSQQSINIEQSPVSLAPSRNSGLFRSNPSNRTGIRPSIRPSNRPSIAGDPFKGSSMARILPQETNSLSNSTQNSSAKSFQKENKIKMLDDETMGEILKLQKGNT